MDNPLTDRALEICKVRFRLGMNHSDNIVAKVDKRGHLIAIQCRVEF